MIGVTITIPGDPGGAAINQARRASIVKFGKNAGKPTTRKSDRHKDWRSDADKAVIKAWGDARALEGPRIIEITTYWPRIRHEGAAAGRPLGDVDATAKAVLDVLEAAGVLGDDGQVWRLVLESHYDKHNPRIEVRL